MHMKEGWEYKKLGEVATIINGKNQKAVENVNGIYPICGSGGIMGYANDFLCPEQTVILGRKGNINRPIFMEQKFWNVDTAFGIVAKKSQLYSKFLYYFCIDFNFEKLNKAVTIPSLVKSDLLKIDMPVPPVSEQQHIVEELDLLSSIIEKKKAQLNELDNLAQSLFYEMFGDPYLNENKYVVKKLGEVCSIERGGSPRPITDYITDAENGINWIKIGDAVEGSKYIMSTAEKIKPEGMKKSRFVHKGDFILSNSMSFGKPYILGVDGCIHDGWLVIHDDNKFFDKSYLYYYLSSPTLYCEFKRLAVGGVVNNLNSKLVRGVKVAIPPINLQHQFASKIEAIEHQKELIRQSIKEVETLFNSRMDYYFN